MRYGFYEAGNTLSKSMVVITVLLGCLMYLHSIKYKFHLAVKVHMIMIAVFVLYWIISDKNRYSSIGDMLGAVKTIDTLKVFLYCNTTFYIFYWLRKKSYISDTCISLWLIIIGICTYISMLAQRMDIISSLTYEPTGVQMAGGYYFANVVPAVFLIRKKKYQIPFVMMCLLCVLASGKRGAILLCSLNTIYYIIETYGRDINNRLALSKMLLALIIAVFVGYFVYDYIINDPFLSARLEKTLDGDSSGRDRIYGAVLDVCLTSNIVHLLFGHGSLSTINLVGGYAHNDWLQMLCDYGLFYVLLYVVFYLQLWTFSRRITNHNQKLMCRLLILTLLYKSCISMGVFSLDSFIIFALLSIIFADNLHPSSPQNL